MSVRYQPDNPTGVDPSRVSGTALEQYRTRFSKRCEGIDDRSLRIKIAQEEGEAQPVTAVPEKALERIRRVEGKQVIFRCESDPTEPDCQDVVFVTSPYGIVTVMTASYWRSSMARHLVPGFHVTEHAWDRLQERFPNIRAGGPTKLDLALHLDRASQWAEATPWRDDGDTYDADIVRHYWCAVDPQLECDSELPVFVVTEPQEPGPDEADRPPLRYVVTVVTARMAVQSIARSSPRATTRIVIPEEVHERAAADSQRREADAANTRAPAEATVALVSLSIGGAEKPPAESEEPTPTPAVPAVSTIPAEVLMSDATPTAADPANNSAGTAPAPAPKVRITFPVRADRVALVLSELIGTGRGVLVTGDVELELVVTGRDNAA